MLRCFGYDILDAHIGEKNIVLKLYYVEIVQKQLLAPNEAMRNAKWQINEINTGLWFETLKNVFQKLLD